MDIRPEYIAVGWLSCSGRLRSKRTFILPDWFTGFGFSEKNYGFQTPSDYLRNGIIQGRIPTFLWQFCWYSSAFYILVQLITIGELFPVTTNGVFPYLPAVLLGTVCVSPHIIGGGMKSVAWLDTFHTILGVCAVYIVVIYLVTKYFPNGGLVKQPTAVC